MLDAVVWGLVQGLTEFLPVSSSGHLVLVPAFLSWAGVAISEPDLAVSAVLHLGTLLAVLVYYRDDLARLARAGHDPAARRVLTLLAIGTVPALVGLPLRASIDVFQSDPVRVAGALVATGLVLWLTTLIPRREGRLEEARPFDAIVVGAAQMTALIPGISRSGMTISAGVGRGLSRAEAARYSFLLAVPTIAGGGLISLMDIGATSVAPGALVTGMAVAGVSGYAAIALLLRTLARVGLFPFAFYAVAVGVAGLLIL